MQKKAKGFTLTEILLVLVIAAAIVIAAFIIYPKVQSSQRAQAEVDLVNTLRAGIHSLYAGTPDYMSLNTDVIIQAKLVPEKMVSENGQLVNSFNGSIDVMPNFLDDDGSLGLTTPNGYSIYYNGVPPQECIKMVSALAPNFKKIRVGENLADVVIDGKLDIGLLATSCGKNSYNIIYFDSYM